MDEQVFLSVSEVARLLKRSEGSVRAYERKGILPAIRIATGARLFRPNDVQKFAHGLSAKTKKQSA